MSRELKVCVSLTWTLWRMIFDADIPVWQTCDTIFG
jgi:hypothetical protein